MKIKVAFFADCLIENYDGAIRTIYHLINRIPTTLFEFIFFTGDGPKEKFDHQVVLLPSVKLPINHHYKITLNFIAKRKMQEALDRLNPDIIHITTPSPLGNAALSYALDRQIPVHSIYHTHFISYIDYYTSYLPMLREPAKKYLISMMQRFYNHCDLVYLPTQMMHHELTQMGIFSNHLKIWKRGLDKLVFNPARRDTEYIKNIMGNDHKNLLFASRLVWEKNLTTLIKIYDQIKCQNLPYNLIVAGDGYAKKELESRMPEAYFSGNLDHQELGRLYASADVFLFTSVSESYGNVVAEAMSSGLPCVIADGGGSTEFIDHGIDGFLCTPNDARSYIDHIELLLNEPELYNQFKQAGINKTKKLNWDMLAAEYFADIAYLAQRAINLRA